MTDSIDSIRQRLELADSLPETFSRNNAANRWREDVTTLLAEVDQLIDLMRHTHWIHNPDVAVVTDDDEPACEKCVAYLQILDRARAESRAAEQKP